MDGCGKGRMEGGGEGGREAGMRGGSLRRGAVHEVERRERAASIRVATGDDCRQKRQRRRREGEGRGTCAGV